MQISDFCTNLKIYQFIRVLRNLILLTTSANNLKIKTSFTFNFKTNTNKVIHLISTQDRLYEH